MSILRYFRSVLVPAVLNVSTPGAYNAEGKWIPGTKVAKNIAILMPQPAPGEFLKQLSEGERTGEFLMTAAESLEGVKTRQSFSDPDEIIFNDTVFEIYSVERWGAYGGADKMFLRKKD